MFRKNNEQPIGDDAPAGRTRVCGVLKQGGFQGSLGGLEAPGAVQVPPELPYQVV